MAFRKISELSSSLTPSGSGIIPIVINGTTFGTTLDAIKDQINSVLTPQYASSSITSSVDTLIGNVSSLNTFTSSADSRLDSIEIFTGSLNDYYATDQELLELREYFNTYSSSNNTVNTQQNIRLDALDGLEIATGSLLTQIETEKGRIDAILLSSDADKDSFKEIVDLINSVDTENDNAFGTYVLNTNDRLDSLEIESGSSSGRLNKIESVSGSWITMGDLPPQPTPNPTQVPVDLSLIVGRLDKLEIESGSIRDEFNSFTSSYLIVSQSFNDRISILEGYHIPQPTPNATPNPTSTPNATPQPTPNATPVPTVEYELYTAYLSRDEGQSAFFELRWTNGTSGATVGFTLSGTATPAQEFGGEMEPMDYTEPTDMFFTVDNSGFVILEIPINEDSQTEGTETIILTLDAQDSNGNPTGGLQKTVTINDTSELQNWEIVTSTHDEGITFNHILKTEHVPAGTEYYWYVGVGIGYPWTPASADDFVGGVLPSGSGTIPVYNETLAISDSIPVSIVADSLTEGDEVYQIIVKDGSPSNPGQHRVIMMMTITDSSLTPVTTPTPTPTPLPVDFTIRFQLDGGNSTYSLKDLSIPQSFGNTHNHTITGYDHDGFETVTTNVVANNGYTFNGNDGELTYAINGSPISNNQGNSTQNTNGFFTTYNSVTDSWDLSIQIGSVGSDLITEGEIIILTISGNAISDPLPTSTPNATPNPTPLPTSTPEPDPTATVEPTSTPNPTPTSTVAPPSPTSTVAPTGDTTTVNISTVQDFTPSLTGLTLWYTEVSQSYSLTQNQYDDTLNWIEVGTYNPIADCSQGNGSSNPLSFTVSTPFDGITNFVYVITQYRDSNGTVIYGSRYTSMCNWNWQQEYHLRFGLQRGISGNTVHNRQDSIYPDTLSIVTPTSTPNATPNPTPTSTVAPTSTPNPTPTETVDISSFKLHVYNQSSTFSITDFKLVKSNGAMSNRLSFDSSGTHTIQPNSDSHHSVITLDTDYNNARISIPTTGGGVYYGWYYLNGSLANQLGTYSFSNLIDLRNGPGGQYQYYTLSSSDVVDLYITETNTPPVPDPTATAEPTSTPNPTPTSTPEPDPTPYPTSTPNATPNPTPTETVAPTSTPNATPNPTPEPEPTLCLTSVNTIQTNSGKYKFNGSAYGPYGVNVGTYVIENVPGAHPIAFLNNGKESLISYSGEIANGSKDGLDGNNYTFYSGDVTVNVIGDFNTLSYECYYHGYMGGENNLVFDETLCNPIPTATPNPIPTATPNPTPAANTIYVHTP